MPVDAKEGATEQEVDIEKKITEGFAKQKLEFEERLKEELSKKETELQKQFDDTVLEMAKTKQEEQEGVAKSEFEILAEKINTKREDEKVKRASIEKDEEKENLIKRLRAYELKEELDKIKKEEPYLADVIDEGIIGGSITSIDQINIIFNSKLKGKLKASYQYEKAIKDAGGDPMSYLQENNIVTDEIAKKKKYDDLVAKKRAKYNIK